MFNGDGGDRGNDGDHRDNNNGLHVLEMVEMANASTLSEQQDDDDDAAADADADETYQPQNREAVGSSVLSTPPLAHAPINNPTTGANATATLATWAEVSSETLFPPIIGIPVIPLAQQQQQQGHWKPYPPNNPTAPPTAARVLPGAFPVEGPLLGAGIINHNNNIFLREPSRDALIFIDHQETKRDDSSNSSSNSDSSDDDGINHLLGNSTTTPSIRQSSASNRGHWQQNRLLFALSMEVNVVLLVVIVVLVGFVLASRGTVGDKTGNHSMTTAGQVLTTEGTTLGKPTMQPTSIMDMLDLPDYTIRAIDNYPRSPQSKAYAWIVGNMKNGTNSSTHLLPAWRLRQRFVLATFYFATRGDYWVKNHGWLDWDVNECEWYQEPFPMDETAACNPAGEVVGFGLIAANNLDGTIPKEIAILSNQLQSLSLAGQVKLQGTVPTEIGLLTSLRSLAVVASRIFGTLPTELGGLQSLKALIINDNLQLSGTIPTEVGQLSKLTLLRFAAINVTGSFPSEVYDLLNLRELGVHECPGLSMDTILSDVVKHDTMQSLHQLTLGIRTNGVEMPIPSEIGHLKELERLFLDELRLHGSIPSEFGNLEKLDYLSLKGNSISGTLPSTLSRLSNLASITATSNQLRGNIPSELFSHLVSLRSFKISDNQFSGSIPTEVGFLSSLKTIELHNNTHITGTLPTELLALDQLTSLTVQNTSLSGSIADKLCGILRQGNLNCFDKSQNCHWEYLEHKASPCQGTSLCGCDCASC